MSTWKHPPRKKPQFRLSWWIIIGVTLFYSIICAWIIGSIRDADLIEAAHIGDFIIDLATPQHPDCPTKGC